MRIGRFDESMIPVAVVKGEERTINRSKKDHGSGEIFSKFTVLKPGQLELAN